MTKLVKYMQQLYGRLGRVTIITTFILGGLILVASTGTGRVYAANSMQMASLTSDINETFQAFTVVSISNAIGEITPVVPDFSGNSGLPGCLAYSDLSRFHNHEYEVCTAYIANSSELARQGFYQFGNNNVTWLSDAAKHHFETRYWDQARQNIEQAVVSWPKTNDFGGNDVSSSITLTSLSSNLKTDRAVLQTQESWKVTAPDGTVQLNQPMQTVNVTMCRGRLPGHLLHEWVVVGFSQMSSFDCVSFDKANNIQP